MCVVPHMSSCITTKSMCNVSGGGWVASGVGGGWGGLEWGWEGAVVMIQDGAKLILAWGCLSWGWHVEVRC